MIQDKDTALYGPNHYLTSSDRKGSTIHKTDLSARESRHNKISPSNEPRDKSLIR